MSLSETWNSNSNLPAASNVVVAARVRPFTFEESRESIDFSPILSVDDGSKCLFITAPKGGARHMFSFNHVFWSIPVEIPNTPFATQEDVYDALGAPTVGHFVSGYNTCIFAYGQTSSGKSYTMMGPDEPYDMRGIIPRCCDAVFEHIERNAKPTVRASVEISYFEIYNERVNCLLEPSNTNLKVREDPDIGPFVDGLTIVGVKDYHDVRHLMGLGAQSRHTASTKLNMQSSRSHAIFSLTLLQQEFIPATGELRTTRSRMNLVDLAGSERTKKSGTSGQSLHEGIYINKSLTVLALVIKTLSEGKGSYVSFRDSTLTWVMKDNLGGNSKTVMVATVSPSSYAYEETLNTLRYAERVKRICMFPVINESSRVQALTELKRELVRLQGEMEKQSRSLGLLQGGLEDGTSIRPVIGPETRSPYLLLMHTTNISLVDILRNIPEGFLFVASGGSMSFRQPIHNNNHSKTRTRSAIVQEPLVLPAQPPLQRRASASTMRRSSSRGLSVTKALQEAQREREESRGPSPPNGAESAKELPRTLSPPLLKGRRGSDDVSSAFFTPPMVRRRGSTGQLLRTDSGLQSLQAQTADPGCNSGNVTPRSDCGGLYPESQVVGFNATEKLLDRRERYFSRRSQSVPYKRRPKPKTARAMTTDDVESTLLFSSLLSKAWSQVSAEKSYDRMELVQPSVAKFLLPFPSPVPTNAFMCCIVRAGHRLSLYVPPRGLSFFPQVLVDGIPVSGMCRIRSSSVIAFGPHGFRLVDPVRSKGIEPHVQLRRRNSNTPLQKKGPNFDTAKLLTTTRSTNTDASLSPSRGASLSPERLRGVGVNTESPGSGKNFAGLPREILDRILSLEESLTSTRQSLSAVEARATSQSRQLDAKDGELQVVHSRLRNEVLEKENLVSEYERRIRESAREVQDLKNTNQKLRAELERLHAGQHSHASQRAADSEDMATLRQGILEATTKLDDLQASCLEKESILYHASQKITELTVLRAELTESLLLERQAAQERRAEEEKEMRLTQERIHELQGQIELLSAKEKIVGEVVERLRAQRDALTFRDIRYLDICTLDVGIRLLKAKESPSLADSVAVRISQDGVHISVPSRNGPSSTHKTLHDVPAAMIAKVQKVDRCVVIDCRGSASISLYVEDSTRRGVLFRTLAMRTGSGRLVTSAEREDE